MLNSKYLRLIKDTVTFLLIVFLAGCAVHSIHDRSYISHSIEDRTGHELRVTGKQGVFKLPDNVSIEDGLALDEAVAIALWNNAQFQVDIVELGFAHADLIEAGLLRNPVLSLLFPLGPKQLEAVLSLPIEFLWQRPQRVAAAKLDVEYVADNLIQHGLDLTRNVMIAYAELALARERAEILTKENAVSEEIAAIASARLKVGDISGLEEAAIRLEAARKKESSIRAARDARLAEERLKTLLGLNIQDKTLELSPVSVSIEYNFQPADLLNKAFAARPDLRAAELAIEASGKRIGWERSKILNLTSMLDANGEGKEGFEIGPGLLLEIPLFNQNNDKVKRAQVELERAARQYLAVKQRISQEVREAHTNCLAAQKALKVLQDDVIPYAETAHKSAEQAYSVGHISYLELLDHKSRFFDSLLRAAEAEAAVRRAEADLKYSVGFSPLK